MRRPTKNQMEWAMLLTLLLSGLIYGIVTDGFLEAMLNLLIGVIVVTFILGLVSLARKLGR